MNSEPATTVLAPIQGLWIGNELSLMEQMSIQSFIHHGHEYHLYVYDEVKGIPAGTKIKDASRVLPNSDIFSKTAMNTAGYVTFSNLFRYQLLKDIGGWWVDLDVACLRPFDFIEPFVFLSEFDSPDGSPRPSTAVMKVPACHPFINDCLEHAKRVDKSTLGFGDIGYKLFRQKFSKYEFGEFLKPPEVFAPVSWWEHKGFTKPEFDWPDLSNSYAIHFYNEMWRQEQVNKNIRYSPETLYGSLQEKYFD